LGRASYINKKVTIMIKCDNCVAEAEYISAPEFASTAYFCSSCIPWSLINDYRAGLLPRVQQPTVAVEAPVVDPEPVVEKTPVEVPAPYKKKKVAEESTDPGAADVSDN